MTFSAGGCDAAYIPEEKFGIKELLLDQEIISAKMLNSRVQRGLILRNEKASDNYSTDFMERLYKEEGKGLFSTRANILGHIQQGGRPSVFDRTMGVKMGSKAHFWILDKIGKNMQGEAAVAARDGKATACVLGLTNNGYRFKPIQDLVAETDFVRRKWNRTWWMRQRGLMKILASRDSDYRSECSQNED